MFRFSILRKTLILVCIVSIGITLGRVTFAAFPAPAATPIGTMNAFGPAEVRELRTKEATVFSGDRIRSFHDAYVRVFLNAGHRIELSSNTDVKVVTENDATKIAMLSGRLAFASSPVRPLQLDVQSFTVLAKPGQSGTIISDTVNLISIASTQGHIEVRNNLTGEMFILRPNTTAFGVTKRQPQQTPQAPQPPQTPPDQDPTTVKVPAPSSSGKALTTKTLIFGGLGGAAAVIAIKAARKDDNVASPSSPR
jgi:hypothetical protein